MNGDPNVAQLQQYTIKLYEEIQEISGQDIGLHLTGGVMLAGTEDRFDWLKSLHAKGRYLGMETEIISPKEAAEIMPLLDPKHFVGAVYDPIEGHLDPSGTTWAYAKAAQKQGGEIHQQTHVEALHQQEDGTWHIHTSQGDIHADHVVNAAVLLAPPFATMFGLHLPFLPLTPSSFLT